MFSYLRRGIVVRQKDVTRIVDETPPPPDALAETVVAPAEVEEATVFQPAMRTVKLGKGVQWKLEKQSLLD